MPILLCLVAAPGAYEVEKVKLDHTPAYTFGMKRKELVRNDTPAPGHYEPEKAKLDSTVAYSFGTKHKEEKPNITPAPGQYEPEKLKLDNAPAYTFGVKTEVKMESHSPGTFHECGLGCAVLIQLIAILSFATRSAWHVSS